MAMIDDRLQFQFVRWTPSREKQRGRHVSGVECDMWGTECRGKGGLPHAGKVAVF